MRICTLLLISSMFHSNAQGMERTEESKVPPMANVEENYHIDLAVYGQGFLPGGGCGLSIRTQTVKQGFECDYSYGSVQKLGISYLYYPHRQYSNFYFGAGPGWLMGKNEPIIINGFCGFQFSPYPPPSSGVSGFIDGGVIFNLVDYFGLPLLTLLTPTVRLGIGTHF